MSGIKISFVMPCRNCEAYLASTFRDLLGQSLENIEVIVYDDASTDGTWDIIQYFADKDKRVVAYRNKEQKGSAFCRNTGNQLVSSKIICCTDAGDRYHMDRAKDSYEYLVCHPNVDFFSTGVEVIDSDEKHLTYEFPEKLITSYGIKPVICHPTVAYRKKVVDKIKYRELTVHSDLYEAFFLEAVKAGFKHGISKDVYVRKRMISGRDIKEARKFKRKVYEEFYIPLPKFLENA